MDYVFFTDADLQFDILELAKPLLSMCPSMRWWWAIARRDADPFIATGQCLGMEQAQPMLFGLRINRHRLRV